MSDKVGFLLQVEHTRAVIFSFLSFRNEQIVQFTKITHLVSVLK